jgi:hypothetical protein
MLVVVNVFLECFQSNYWYTMMLLGYNEVLLLACFIQSDGHMIIHNMFDNR